MRRGRERYTVRGEEREKYAVRGELEEKEFERDREIETQYVNTKG